MLLIRFLLIGACAGGLAGCEVLRDVLGIVLDSDPAAFLKDVKVPETVRLGKEVAVSLEVDVSRGYHLSEAKTEVNDASHSVVISCSPESDPLDPAQLTATEGATASPSPKPYPVKDPLSKKVRFVPKGLGRYTVEAQLTWGLRSKQTATRSLVVLPP